MTRGTQDLFQIFVGDLILQYKRECHLYNKIKHSEYLKYLIQILSLLKAETLPLRRSITNMRKRKLIGLFWFINMLSLIKSILKMKMFTALKSQQNDSCLRTFLRFAHLFGQIFYFQNSASHFVSSGKFKFYNANKTIFK